MSPTPSPSAGPANRNSKAPSAADLYSAKGRRKTSGTQLLTKIRDVVDHRSCRTSHDACKGSAAGGEKTASRRRKRGAGCPRLPEYLRRLAFRPSDVNQIQKASGSSFETSAPQASLPRSARRTEVGSKKQRARSVLSAACHICQMSHRQLRLELRAVGERQPSKTRASRQYVAQAGIQ